MRLAAASLGLGLALAWAAPRPASAYVTAATLEYSCDDYGTFYINGKYLARTDILNWSDFAVFSTSDGSLPLSLFNPNGDNLLAVESQDTEGGAIGMSYRLTVHHSSGDPVVVWSQAANTRFLHLSARQPSPAGWYLPGFDDSAWGQAYEVQVGAGGEWSRFACLEDPNFGIFGSKGCVPELAHLASGRTGTHDHNLMRTHFAFPNTPAKVELQLSARSAARGQAVRARLVPGPDASYLASFRLAATLPRGLRLSGLSAGGKFDAQRSLLTWDYAAASSGVGYLTLPAASVLEAPGWSRPEKVLGGYKPGKVRKRTNELAVLFDDGASFPAGPEGWFRMQAPPAGSVPPGARITGVIFHAQMRVSGIDTMEKSVVAPIYFNYSVDGSRRGSLAKDVLVSRTSGEYYWVDGYHDATVDRAWSWDDLSRLNVMYKSRQKRLKNVNLLASSVVTVRYFVPGKISPGFEAVVEDAACREAEFQAGLLEPGRPLLRSDPLRLALNPGGCPPTPQPTPSPRPTATPLLAQAPTPEPTRAAPEPTPAGLQLAGGQIRLGCLESAPEPFKRGGVYLSFCVQQPSRVSLAVYDSRTGKRVRSLEAGEFPGGAKSQLYFNGLDEQGQPLLPGAYIYELRASSNGLSETRNAAFRRAKD